MIDLNICVSSSRLRGVAKAFQLDRYRPEFYHLESLKRARTFLDQFVETVIHFG